MKCRARWMGMTGAGLALAPAGCDDSGLDVTGSIIGTLLSVYDIVSLWI